MGIQYGMIKRMEHFWKSLSNDEKQISPIPPERYGDRFIRFISGVTKSPEEIAQEPSHETVNPHSTNNNYENTTEPFVTSPGGTNSIAQTRHRRRSSVSAPGVGSESEVIDRAERSRDRASKELEREDARPPDKKISTARSPSAERGEPGGFTLPVVEEGGSGDEREGSPAMPGGERRKEQ
jgi:1-phosphatidylinositol-4-phosphate 5-kinase